MEKFISKEILDVLSYQSQLKRSLKQISLSQTPLEEILEDIGRYRASYIDVLVQENLIGSRFKSDDSIIRKYEKTLKNNGGFKQCFNDVLGFRLKYETYPTEFPEYFRVVDLRSGKKSDDGYRAIHLYYQRDNKAYPIEVPRGTLVKISTAIWHLAPLPAHEEELQAMIILPECTYANDCTVVDLKKEEQFVIEL